jgi:hypothetical protein
MWQNEQSVCPALRCGLKLSRINLGLCQPDPFSNVLRPRSRPWHLGLLAWQRGGVGERETVSDRKKPMTANLQANTTLTVKQATKLLNVSERLLYMARELMNTGRADVVAEVEAGDANNL